MKDINQNQESPNVYRIRKLLKKTRIRIGREIRYSYKTNKEETEMTIKTIKKKDVLTDQEKDITIETNTTLRFKSFISHENERVRLHDYDRTVTKERVINIHVKKDDRNRIEL